MKYTFTCVHTKYIYVYNSDITSLSNLQTLRGRTAFLPRFDQRVSVVERLISWGSLLDIPLRTEAIASSRKVVNDFSKDFSRLFYLKMDLTAFLYSMELMCRKCGKLQRGWVVCNNTFKRKLSSIGPREISPRTYLMKQIFKQRVLSSTKLLQNLDIGKL